MSLMLSGPRRVYVLLLVWQRLGEPRATSFRTLSRAERAMGAEPPERSDAPCGVPCRLVLTMRVQRAIGRRLVGLSLLVLDAAPREA